MGVAQVTDLFAHPPAPIKFDRWHRYLLPNPQTMQRQAWTRATTFARSIVDSYALNAWQQRMAAKGMSLRPDLVALVSTLDVSKDRAALDKLVEQAKDTAGDKVAANKGTALHAFTEQLDSGALSVIDVPQMARPDVAAYQAEMNRHRMRVLPDLTERVTCVPVFSVAGRLDKVVQCPDGKYRIGDVKSGQKLDLSALEISIQLALYAHGVNASGVWDQSTEAWSPLDFKVETDYAVIMHMPAGSGTCGLKRADIREGWEAAKLCMQVREQRNIKGLITPLDEPVPSAPEPDWDGRFGFVRTREEASALYQEAAGVFGAQSERLKDLVQIGLKALRDA